MIASSSKQSKKFDPADDGKTVIFCRGDGFWMAVSCAVFAALSTTFVCFSMVPGTRNETIIFIENGSKREREPDG